MRISVRRLSAAILCGILLAACNKSQGEWNDGLPAVMTNPTSHTVVYKTEEETTVTEPITLPDIESTSRTAATEKMPDFATTTSGETTTTEETEPTVSVVPDIPNVPIRQFTTTQASYPVPATSASSANSSSAGTGGSMSESTASSGTADMNGTGTVSEQVTAATVSVGESIYTESNVTEAPSVTDPYQPFTIKERTTRPYGYKNLDSKGLYIYDSIIDSAEKKSAYVDLSGMDGISTQDYCDVYELLYNDENSMFYLDTKMQYAINTSTQTVRSATVFYKYSNAEIQRMQAEIDAEVNNIISKITAGMSQYDIVKLFYDYLAENVVYDEDAPNCRDIYGVFVDKKAICGGYSKAFSYLCDRVGIETLTITGDADEIPHMWNMVNLGGEWYHIDITYAVTDSKLGSYVRYDYFCVTDEVIDRSRVVYEQTYSYPKATSRRCNYYVRNGLVADSWDQAYELLYNRIIIASANKELVAQIQCGSKAVYDAAVYNLFSPSQKQALDLMEDALTKSANKYKCDNISYGQDDNTYVIKLFLEYTN